MKFFTWQWLPGDYRRLAVKAIREVFVNICDFIAMGQGYLQVLALLRAAEVSGS
ncbi:MAG: hypothetical protein N0E50_04715 [Candidatus Thiodiazotropha taylori]|nr:hypothetical protein [Candidatus Thiodiazotropha taylori]